MQGRVLVVAGSDSGGGAGVQAGKKTITLLGGHAMTAITALTAQNTLGVHAIHDVPPDFVAEQMRTALDDIGADCVKIGMARTAEAIEAIANALPDGVPVVLDPVMVAKGGASLMEDARALKNRLLPRASVLTPNIPEAEALTGLSIQGPDDMAPAARALAAMTGGAVLLKGGHLEGDDLVDLLWENGQERVFKGKRLDTPHTHGTGCTMASAVATGIAQGMELADAVARARDFVTAAIRAAPGLGGGHGPLGHGRALKTSGH